MRMRWKSGTAAVLFTAALLILNGCAGRWPRSGPPDGQGETSSAGGDRRWSCVPVEEDHTGAPADIGESWTPDAGRMVSSHHSSRLSPDFPGQASPDNAMGSAVASATEAALGLLEQRGIAYTKKRRRSIVDAAVKGSLRGDGIGFPRMSVVDKALTRCVSTPRGAPSDTCWRATVVVEYPIGQLRGDANNVRWERSRVANEASVLRSSAADYLDDGRWLRGLLETAHVVKVIEDTGADVAAGGARTDLEGAASRAAEEGGLPSSDASPDAELAALLEWSYRAGREVSRLTARPSGRMGVIEVGATAGAEVAFSVTYEWGGRTVPAVGVPVGFRMPGASAVLDFEPVTDGSGMAVCRILRADGDPGEYELELGLDEAASQAALSWLGEGAISPHGGTEGGSANWLPLASKKIQLVSGAHATSVCLDLQATNEADVAQAYAGFTRRMERDGFRVEECGPDVGIVITGEISLTADRSGGIWTATATLTASAFDQRTASPLDEATMSSKEREAADVPDPRRSAEVLALKEVGRLLAVYFEGRMLSRGS
jgi:hypothetical protein